MHYANMAVGILTVITVIGGLTMAVVGALVQLSVKADESLLMEKIGKLGLITFMIGVVPLIMLGLVGLIISS